MSSGPLFLLIRSGPGSGRSFDLPADGVVRVGSSRSCQIHLEAPGVLGVHCFLKCAQGKVAVVVTDPNATVTVNQAASRKKLLEPGDAIGIGEVTLSLEGAEKDPLVGSILGGYRIEERLGRGGMGTVYRANQLSLEREVALKILSPELIKDGDFVKEFLREARAAAKLNHPNVVQIYDAVQDDQTFFFSMEYLPGGTLQQHLEAKGRLPLEQALEIGRDTALALVWAEEHGIVHRDIKPDNLLFSADGKVKVADLGIAADLYGGKGDEKRRGIGSPRYMAPEQALQQPVDHRADIYALGSTLYRMIAGRPPFDGKTKAEIIKAKTTSDAEPLEMLLPEIPSRVSDLVAKMMARDPAGRPSSCAELLPELEKCLELARGSSAEGIENVGRGVHSTRSREQASRERQGAMAYLESAEGFITVTLSAFLVIGAIVWSILWEPPVLQVAKTDSFKAAPADASGSSEADTASPVVEKTAPPKKSGVVSPTKPQPPEGGDLHPVVTNPQEVALLKEVNLIMNRWEAGLDTRKTLAALDDFKRKHPETNYADKYIKQIRDALKERGSSAFSKYLAGECATLVKASNYHQAVNGLVELANAHPENLEEINAEIKKLESAAEGILKKAEEESRRAAEGGDFARAVSVLKDLQPTLPSRLQASVGDRIQALSQDEKDYVASSKTFNESMDKVLEAVNALDFDRALSLATAIPQMKSASFSKRRALTAVELQRCREGWEKIKAGANRAIGSGEEVLLAFEADPAASQGSFRLKGLEEGGALSFQGGDGSKDSRHILSLTSRSLLLLLGKGQGGKGGEDVTPEIMESLGLLLLYHEGPGRAKDVLLDSKLPLEKQEAYKERLPREEEPFLSGVLRRAMARLKELSDAAKAGTGATGLTQRWETLASDAARSIVAARKLPGYVNVRDQLLQVYLRARAEALRVLVPQNLFHGKVKSYKPDGSIELAYDFISEDEKKDFLRIKGSNSLMEIENKSAKIMGEFRLGRGDVFRNKLTVAGKAAAGGYNPDRPNINIAFWTHDEDAVSPLRRIRKPNDPAVDDATQPPKGVPGDYLVFAIGYRAPVLDSRLEEHEQLTPRGAGAPVSMPLNAVLGGYRGKPLHTAPEEECFWATNVSSKIKGSQEFRIALAPGSVTWTINTRAISLRDMKGAELMKRPEPYTGSVSFFTNGEVVLYDSITVVGELNQEWVEAELRALAVKDLKKFEPSYPFKPDDEKEWEKLLKGGKK